MSNKSPFPAQVMPSVVAPTAITISDAMTRTMKLFVDRVLKAFPQIDGPDNRSPFFVTLLFFTLAFLSVGVLGSPVHGQSIWTGNSSQLWNISGNWNPTGAPAASANLTFDGSASLFLIDIGEADRTANSVLINSLTPYRFEDSNPGQTFFPGNVSVNDGTGHEFALPVSIGSDATYSISTGKDLLLSDHLSESVIESKLTKTGAGTLTVSGGTVGTPSLIGGFRALKKLAPEQVI